MHIIFDFNRTIYDPETTSLMDGALELLSTLHAKGVRLSLVSKREGERAATLETLGIAQFFDGVYFVDHKEDIIRTLITDTKEQVYVVGDYLHNEIRYGNKYGALTIWLKRGRFSQLVPETSHDTPWRTIETFSSLPKLLLD